jgi:hypothetical protein
MFLPQLLHERVIQVALRRLSVENESAHSPETRRSHSETGTPKPILGR